MAESFGKKMICQECGTKFFDMGKPKPKCPRCGAANAINLETAIIKSRPKEIPPPVIEPEEEPAAELEEDDSEESEAELSTEEESFGEEEEETADEMDETEETYEADEL